MIGRLVTVSCILLALATGILGMLSWSREIVCLERAAKPQAAAAIGPELRLAIDKSCFQAEWSQVTAASPARPSDGVGSFTTGKIDAIVFKWHRQQYAGAITGSSCHLAIPVWSLLALWALWPATAFVRGPYRRCRRRRKGLCITCSYDLTGNTSGVCPECGERI